MALRYLRPTEQYGNVTDPYPKGEPVCAINIFSGVELRKNIGGWFEKTPHFIKYDLLTK